MQGELDPEETHTHDIEFIDLAPAMGDTRTEVLKGLSKSPKELPCKLFYDLQGSLLFEQICELPEYYPTRTETSILRANAGEMADVIGPGALLIEYGSGSSTKTPVLLAALRDLAAYMPMDISRDHLRHSSKQIAASHPGLRVVALCADYTRPITPPAIDLKEQSRVVFFPGSTIGNFDRSLVVGFLKSIRASWGSDVGLLIGVDLKKDPATLEAAYDDSAGVTAAFNKNALVHLNRVLGADFELDQYRHLARYDESAGRIEMHLVSQCDQTVTISGETFSFAEGERIHTESSYKYTVEQFQELAGQAGFVARKTWTDEKDLFSVQYFKGS